ncbi:guanine-1-methyltransferase-domain-containing protein [Cyathus striatus]|nr:guanine-1-methyltransferase-domain-containing protein [Cyathus striatus]
MSSTPIDHDTQHADLSANTPHSPVASHLLTPESSGTSSAPANPNELPSLSKKALKKAAKAEHYAAIKLERRAREREARKEKKRIRAEKRAAGELDEDEENSRQKKRPKLQFGGRIVVDLAFDDKMSEKEVNSLCSQLAYTYSANRQASFPFSLIYTSLNGRTFSKLEGMSDAGYKRWAHTEWWHEGYERLWLDHEGATGSSRHSTVNHDPIPGSPSTSENLQKAEAEIAMSQDHISIQQTIVYLTADSDDELTELRPDETYIIGGIVDHNRYKNLCLNKAKESGIRTARLPIGRYLASLPTRKVLTVNQVFEILVKWVETRNWEEAFHCIIPKRKFHAGGKGKVQNEISTDRRDDEPEEATGTEQVVISAEEVEQIERVDSRQ